MTPTDEQLEEIESLMHCCGQEELTAKQSARNVWNLIAPIVRNATLDEVANWLDHADDHMFAPPDLDNAVRIKTGRPALGRKGDTT